MTTIAQLPVEFKKVNGYRFSLNWYKGFAAQGINSMAYNYQIEDGWSLSNLVLNYDDVLLLDTFFQTIGLTGDYKSTKSGSWVRCHNDLTKKQLLELRKFIKGK